MIRFSLAIVAIAVVSTASGLHAQTYYYPGEVTTYQPIYPIAQPLQTYSTYQYTPTNEVAPYPIAAPLPQQAASTVTQPQIISKQTKLATTKPVASTTTVNKAASKTSLPSYRKSEPARIHPVASAMPSTNFAPAAQSYSRPVIQYQPPAQNFAAPNFFAPQNCFSGR